jgi:integrase
MDAKITTQTQRANLKFRDEPYWRKLGAGSLGFRKRPNGVEAWVAKWTGSQEMLESGTRRKTPQKVLATLQELPEYKEAEKAANAWFDQCKGGVVRAGTVQEACTHYVGNQHNEKGKDSANASEIRFKSIWGTAFGLIKLDELTTRNIEVWRDGLVTPECQANSVNRILRSLKAAMNFAFQRGMCPSDAAWRRVKPLRGPGSKDGQRTAHLTVGQRKALLAECYPDLAVFVRALLYTAARVGEIQDAKRRDFDPKQGTIRLAGKTGERSVPLSKAAIEFFKEVCKDKLPEAHLLTYEGYRWQRQLWARGIHDAVIAANKKLEGDERLPADTVAYTMRHCAITDMLSAGINVAAVAKIAGTGIMMIQKNYFKFIATDVSEKLGQITAF